MATLQRFKLLATQCATASGRSPSRSPSASPSPAKSPSFHLRRHRNRRTLRRFLGRSGAKDPAPKISIPAPDREEKKGLLRHTSLKDLFVSSPSPPPSVEGNGRGGGEEPGGGRGIGWSRLGFEAFGARRGSSGGVAARWRSGGALRYRLLRRAWRPVLVTIPE